MAFGWLKKAARSAGKGLKKVGKVALAPVKLTAKAGRTIGKQLGKVPIVGGGLKGVFDLTVNAPFQVAGHIANGDRIDKVALAAVRDHVQAVKAVAPYAQTVISIVPAVGPGINAGLSAGLALASGQPITQAILEGAKAALPGGPLAKQIFSVGQAAVTGKPLKDIVLSTLPLDANTKKGLGVALDVSSRLAKGERVDKALLAQADKAMSLLPADARKALQVGTALGQGQNLQKIAAAHVNVHALDSLKKGGANLIKASPVLASAGTILKSPAAKVGYSVGVGMLAHKNPQPFHMVAIRGRLDPTQRQGFDMAVAARAGMVATKLAAPKSAPPSQQLGFYVTQGVSKTASAPAMLRAVKTNPATKAGAAAAIVHIQTHQPSRWERFKVWFLGNE